MTLLNMCDAVLLVPTVTATTKRKKTDGFQARKYSNIWLMKLSIAPEDV
jgi:hypothetical protein